MTKQETKILWKLFPNEMMERFKTKYGFKQPYFAINNLTTEIEQQRLKELREIEGSITDLKNRSDIYLQWAKTHDNNIELN